MRNAKLIITIIFLIISTTYKAQNSKAVVAEFGNYKIYLDEFEKSYAKNSGGYERAKKDSLSSLQKYLDLFVNYKMKLRDAEVRGYTKDEDLMKELNDYKANVGTTLMLEKFLYEPAIRKMYDRRKTEYRASHIMLIPNDSVNDVQTLELGKSLIKRIKNGEDFTKLVQEYSKDLNTAKYGGDVYYFTSGQVNVPAIEDSVYKLEEGQITSAPVYSGYGYHIIKVTEKHPRRASVHAMHILASYTDSMNVVDSTKALNKIKDVQKKLKEGSDFLELAKKYSDDPGGKSNGGDLGFFRRGAMIKPFDEAVFKLNKGEVSDIVQTQFGYHLIKLIDIAPTQSFEESKEELRDSYKRTRYNQDYKELCDKLKTDLKFERNQSTVGKIESKSKEKDTIKVNEEYWKSNYHKEIGKLPIFSLASKDYPVDSLFAYMIRKGSHIGKNADTKLLTDVSKEYSEDVAIRSKALEFDKEDSNFASLIDEYVKGMYLFKILDEEVWSKLNIDTVKVKSYWETNKNNFKWNNRADFKEIFAFSDTTINDCYKKASAGANFDSLYKQYHKKPKDELKINSGLVEIGSNPIAKEAYQLKNIGDITNPIKNADGWSIAKLVKRDAARLKTYEESKAEAASQLQEAESKRLEDEYLVRLKNLYHPKIYYDQLEKAFKE